MRKLQISFEIVIFETLILPQNTHIHQEPGQSLIKIRRRHTHENDTTIQENQFPLIKSPPNPFKRSHFQNHYFLGSKSEIEP